MSAAPYRSLQVVAAGSVELVDALEPAPLGAHEVAGRTLATLVSPGTEIASAFAPAEPTSVDYPRRIGYASVFEIDEVGAEVEGLAVGDRVFSAGPHASRQRADAAQVVPLPAGLDAREAVFARMIAVPMAALVTTRARPGDRVGVSGLGLVGHLAAKAFHASGYRVTAWDPVADRRALLPEGVRVRADAGGGEFELVVEASGHDGAAVEAAKVVARDGELVLTGTPWARRSDASAHELLHLVFHRYLHVRSGWEWQLPTLPTDFRTGSVIGNFRRAIDWLASGAVRVDGLARVVPPNGAQAAFEALAGRTASELTVVFDWDGPSG
jgi:threonine dehydrogenase-like Zn-dependent dehydrogenase